MTRGPVILFIVISFVLVMGCTPLQRQGYQNQQTQQNEVNRIFEEITECPRGIQTVKTFGFEDYILRPSADGSFLVFSNKDNHELGLTSSDNSYNQVIEINGVTYTFRAKVEDCNIIFITDTDASSSSIDNLQDEIKYPISVIGRITQDATDLTLNINTYSKEIIVALPLAGKSIIISQSSYFENAESMYLGNGKWKITSKNQENKINGKISLSFVPDLEFYPGEVPIAYLFARTSPIDGKVAIKSYMSLGIGY